MAKSRGMADCHPDRPHYAKGLCEPCYKHQHYEENRERHLALGRKWREENRQHKLELNRDWVERNREHKQKFDRDQRKAKPRLGYSQKLLRRYGISLAVYDEMLRAQNDACAICGRVPDKGDRRLSVDHDHTTNAVRGLLCNNCNLLIGLSRESPKILANAISYLKETNKGES